MLIVGCSDFITSIDLTKFMIRMHFIVVLASNFSMEFGNEFILSGRI